jgi:hypothetical protein
MQPRLSSFLVWKLHNILPYNGNKVFSFSKRLLIYCIQASVARLMYLASKKWIQLNLCNLSHQNLTIFGSCKYVLASTKTYYRLLTLPTQPKYSTYEYIAYLYNLSIFSYFSGVIKISG